METKYPELPVRKPLPWWVIIWPILVAMGLFGCGSEFGPPAPYPLRADRVWHDETLAMSFMDSCYRSQFGSADRCKCSLRGAMLTFNEGDVESAIRLGVNLNTSKAMARINKRCLEAYPE